MLKKRGERLRSRSILAVESENRNRKSRWSQPVITRGVITMYGEEHGKSCKSPARVR